jgi:hypothetical protein
MSWPASILVAVLTGAAGLVVSGFIANLAVDWYRISSFEGGSGYFVVAMALLGGAAGAVIGLVGSRIVGAGTDPSFIKALGTSLGVVLAISVAVGGTARLLADVPPTIDGEELWLAVEVQWPQEDTTSPAALAGEGYVSLHSLPRFGRTVRASRQGPLWLEDARRVEGRWVVPGAVDIFTNRGKRLIDIGVGDSSLTGVLIPLTRPTASDHEWSPWYPLPNAKAPASSYRFLQRYRVLRNSEPIRTQTVGPFEIASISNGAYRAQAGDKWVLTLSGVFRIQHNGQTVPGFDSAGTVAVLSADGTALLARVERDDGEGTCYLITARNDAIDARPVSGCTAAINGQLLTADLERFREAQQTHAVPGLIDRVTFATPGLYRLHEAVIDTRTMTARPFSEDPSSTPIPSVPPLSVSPDASSFVTFAYVDGSADNPVLVVTELGGGTHYHLPIDGRRMRFATLESLDPAWVAHHFVWQRDAAGVDRLVERPGFTPIPYRGTLTQNDSLSQSYRVEKAGSALRAQLVEFLVSEFHAVVTPGAEPDAYEHEVRIDGRAVKVAASSDFGYVLVSVETGTADGGLVAKIAERFDAALRTGRYDAMFAP